MNIQEARELAKLLEETTYQGVRDGLVRDLREGKYRENGPMAMPFESLFIALAAVEAPREAVERAQAINAAANTRAAPLGPPSADSPEVKAALRHLYGEPGASSAFKVPVETDLEGLTDEHLKKLLPASAFLDAVVRQQQDTLASEIDDAEVVHVGDDTPFTSPQ